MKSRSGILPSSPLVPFVQSSTVSCHLAIYLGKGYMIQPMARATARKQRNKKSPYLRRSLVVSFDVSEKTIDTQKAKTTIALK
jgi:hypothetical protein